MSRADFFKKYDVPVPRYTSYPTVPFWTDSPTTDQWITELRRAFSDANMSWAMYLHIPFCETLCTYCGCNTVITKDHGREAPYVELLLKEWNLYLERVPDILKRPLRQLHLGGGTPTFLTPEHLRALLNPIFQKIKRTPEFEASIEVDPRRTTVEHLKALRDVGFDRVSMGVQDFDAEVQRLVNRSQPFEITKNLTEEARRMGYSSVNYDLIYGLPKQSVESIQKTAQLTVQLRPDRIALYSLAVVPWIKPAQRLFKDEDLPKGEDKRHLYEIAREILLKGGYVEVGMDHFALPSDSLHKAMQTGELHRNFMGYTEFRTKAMIGLGVSAISETPTCFHQNEKVLPVYERRVGQGELPTLRGHLLSEVDRRQREQILQFMTDFQVELRDDAQAKEAGEFLKTMIQDGLVRLTGRKLELTSEGRPFLRNACVFFDSRLRTKEPQTKLFSQAI